MTMEKLYKRLAVTFIVSIVLSGMILAVSLYFREKLKRHLKNYEMQLAKARTEAERDHLTGLYNRNGFEQRAEHFLKKESPGGALLLLDLDNFKRINDRQGHPEGDFVLQVFAECLTDFFRKEDVIGRLGGDEFAVLIGNPIPDHILAEKIARFRTEVRRRLEKYYDQYSVSVSIGAAPVDGTVLDYRKLYQCADTALYVSKYQGKDSFYINKG